MSYRGYKDLKVYQLSYRLAMDIFQITKTFPKEERYSLTDQIRRSSRSVATNIAEAWKKRIYPKMFLSKVIDSAGEAAETEVWLDIAKDAEYLSIGKYKELSDGYDEVNRMLYGMFEKPERFSTKASKSM
jgi:four helix bundle protein